MTIPRLPLDKEVLILGNLLLIYIDKLYDAGHDTMDGFDACEPMIRSLMSGPEYKTWRQFENQFESERLRNKAFLAELHPSQDLSQTIGKCGVRLIDLCYHGDLNKYPTIIWELETVTMHLGVFSGYSLPSNEAEAILNNIIENLIRDHT